jgi:hypothetical protein
VTSSKVEAKEILAELRAILEDTLKILDTKRQGKDHKMKLQSALEILEPESTKQNSKYQPVFEKTGEKPCQTISM